MAKTVTFQTTTVLDGERIATSVDITAAMSIELDESVSDGQTDVAIDPGTIDVSEVKFLMLVSDKAVTVETNSGTVPDYTFTLGANVPWVWHESMGIANPITVDITSLFVTNASGAAAALQMRVLVDPTP